MLACFWRHSPETRQVLRLLRGAYGLRDPQHVSDEIQDSVRAEGVAGIARGLRPQRKCTTLSIMDDIRVGFDETPLTAQSLPTVEDLGRRPDADSRDVLKSELFCCVGFRRFRRARGDFVAARQTNKEGERALLKQSPSKFSCSLDERTPTQHCNLQIPTGAN